MSLYSAAFLALSLFAPGDARVARETHWAWQPLHAVAAPAVKNPAWCRTPIDRFILLKLEQRGLKPSPPADRRTLIRRVTFDLIGLPPTPNEVDAFVRSRDPLAYDKLVDRLLASPRYGERWGRHWLDVVHYGDTHGYDKDKRRDNAWRYRDYVIRAFNRDKPYSQFIREQIAGDVLWPADADAVIATGFVAAGPWDFVGHEELREGTVEKAKTRLLDRDDMVANTLSTFDSVTVHCARCHDHKFDPIPQRDYYRLQACFAGVDRGDRPVPDDAGTPRGALQAKEERLAVSIRQLEDRATAVANADPQVKALDRQLEALEGEMAKLPTLPEQPSPSNGYHSALSAAQEVTKWVQLDLGRPMPIDTIRLVPARPTDFPDTKGFGFPVRFKVELADDASFAKSRIVLDSTSQDYANPLDKTVAISCNGASARFVRVTATRLWKRSGDYAFALAEMQVMSDGKNVAPAATVSAFDTIEAGRWSVKYLVDGYDSRGSLPDLSNPKIAALVAQWDAAVAKREALDRRRAERFLATVPHEVTTSIATQRDEMAAVDRQLQAMPPRNVFALQTHPLRPVFVLARGDVEKPLEPATPGALRCVAGLSADFDVPPGEEGMRRVALANWIANPKNALTWRSIVNRVWHYHFGKGIVDTPNDFGKNGGRPSHPELLDWLADTFQADRASGGIGQSLKALHRMIVLSAVYRQSSGENPEYAKVDGDNRLLWRMNRQRLDAEEVRDSILAVSGKLDFTMDGPGFELFRFKDDHSPVYDHSAIDKINDPKGWRRSVYRFVVRSVPNPFMECLDCADPNINTPVRNTTLTALQALALLNDPFVLDQSQHFADRVSRETRSPEEQIRTAVRLAFGREPTSAEVAELGGYVKRHGLAAACRLLYNANEFVFVD